MNELIFYSGIIAVSLALVAGLVSLFVIKIRFIKLAAKFDEEYGKKRV